MSIKRPDIYEHNNPKNALLDSEFLRGGRRSVADLAGLYALKDRPDQLKQFVSIIHVEAEDKDYLLTVNPVIDNVSVGNSTGWREVTYDGAGSVLNLWSGGLEWEEGDYAIWGQGIYRARVDIAASPEAGTASTVLPNAGTQLALDTWQLVYSSASPADLAGKQSRSEKNTANGYVGLDANAKIPTAYLPAIITGAMSYKGSVNATTGVITSNDPALNGQTVPAAAAGNVGWYFIVSTAGTLNTITYAVGDWMVSNGAAGWSKIDNTQSVTSVAGRTGAVTLTKEDVGLTNVENTSDADKPVSTAQAAALEDKADLNPVVEGELNSGKLVDSQEPVFEDDILVSLSNGKRFLGRWADGETAPARGKTARGLIEFAAKEAIAPVVSLATNISQQEFNQTNFAVLVSWNITIKTLNATLANFKLYRTRDSGSNPNWGAPILDTAVPGNSYNDTALNPAIDNRNIRYRTVVTDSAGAVTTTEATVTFKAYVAPSITSVTIGTETRERGNTATTYTATITRVSPNVPLASYTVQYQLNGAGAWTNVGAGGASMPSGGTTINVAHDESASEIKNADSINYRVVVTDSHQQTTGGNKTLNLRYKSVLGYASTETVSLATLLGFGNTALTNDKERVVEGVTAQDGQYTYYGYNSGDGALTNVIMDGSSPILGALTRLPDLSGVNSYGAAVTYAVYRSNATKAFTNNSLDFK